MTHPDDNDIWQLYARTVKRVASIRKRSTKPDRAKTIPQDMAHNRRAATVILPPPVMEEVARDLVTTLDRRMEKKLRDGSIIVDARLDLHGMTQIQAYAVLETFMVRALAAAHRVVLIITGKGRGGDGVLRSHLPGWLHSLPGAAEIMAVRPAAIRHGGDGAFYVMLRRKKIRSGE